MKSTKIHRMYSDHQKQKVVDYARTWAASRKFGIKRNIGCWKKDRVDEIKTGNVSTMVYRKEESGSSCQHSYVTSSCSISNMSRASFLQGIRWVGTEIYEKTQVGTSCTHVNCTAPRRLGQQDYVVLCIFKTSKDYLKIHLYIYWVIWMRHQCFFDCVPGKMLNKCGAKTIKVRTTGAEKCHLTVVLCCTALGEMLPPMTIFKAKGALVVPKGCARKRMDGWN